MADEIDQAQANIEQSLELAFKTRKRDSLRPVGRCWYCYEKLVDLVLFCSSECRDDWDKEQAARARAGLPQTKRF